MVSGPVAATVGEATVGDMTTSRIALIALTTAAVLGVAACGSDPAPSNPDDTVTMSSSEPSTSEPVESSSSTSGPSSSGTATGSKSPDSDGGLAAVTAAIDAAESESGGTAYEIDDQDDDDSWEIDLAKDGESIEVEVSADGKVTDRDEDDLDADDRKAISSARTTIGQAIEKALAEVDGTFDGAELEEEGGTWSWQVSVDTGGTGADDDDREVLVGTTDGKVTVTD